MESAVAVSQTEETQAAATVHGGLRLADTAPAAAGSSRRQTGRLVGEVVDHSVQAECVQLDL